VQCLIKSELQASANDEDDEDDEAATSENSQLKAEVREILESLSQRMAKCDLEDFELVSAGAFNVWWCEIGVISLKIGVSRCL
jgi:Fanconi anemia group I protein